MQCDVLVLEMNVNKNLYVCITISMYEILSVFQNARLFI